MKFFRNSSRIFDKNSSMIPSEALSKHSFKNSMRNFFRDSCRKFWLEKNLNAYLKEFRKFFLIMSTGIVIKTSQEISLWIIAEAYLGISPGILYRNFVQAYRNTCTERSWNTFRKSTKIFFSKDFSWDFC